MRRAQANTSGKERKEAVSFVNFVSSVVKALESQAPVKLRGRSRGGALERRSPKPQQAPRNHQKNRDQLRRRKRAAENAAASGIVAQKLQEEPRHTIEEQIRADHLALKSF